MGWRRGLARRGSGRVWKRGIDGAQPDVAALIAGRPCAGEETREQGYRRETPGSHGASLEQCGPPRRPTTATVPVMEASLVELIAAKRDGRKLSEVEIGRIITAFG